MIEDGGKPVASGEGWFATFKDGRLEVTVRAPDLRMSTGPRGGQATITMPADFVPEIMRARRALRGGE